MKDTIQTYSLERIIDNLPSAIIVLNEDTEIIFTNLFAEKFSNKSRQQLKGLRGGEAFKCVHANDVPKGCGYGPDCRMCSIRNTVEATMTSHENANNVEAVMNFSDKGKRVLTVNTVYLKEDNIVIVALSDITDLKEFENIRLEKERLLAAIQTGGGVCHEMNQPLTVLNGYIDLSLIELDKNSPIFEYLTLAQNEIARLKDISYKLLNLTSFKTRNYLSEKSHILDIENSSKIEMLS